jgi:hypothetical protein
MRKNKESQPAARGGSLFRWGVRKAVLLRLAMFCGMLLVLQGAKCPQIPEMETVEVTAVAEEYVEMEFVAEGSINYHQDEVTIDVLELLSDLEEADIEVDQIDTVLVHAILYGVTVCDECEQYTDRRIVDGHLEVTRKDTQESAVIFDNVDVDVCPLIGELVPAPIEPGAADFINELLADVLVALKTGSPSTFELEADVSGLSEPQERDTNFDWRVRIVYQVKGRVEVERPSL